LHLLAKWVASEDVQIDIDDDLNVDEGFDPDTSEELDMDDDPDTDDGFDTDTSLNTDEEFELYDWSEFEYDQLEFEPHRAQRRSPFRRVFASLHQCTCIVGRPGSGKSTIATTVIAKLLDDIHHHCPGLVSAHYCIRKTDSSTLHPNKVLPTIILELARASPALALSIDKILTPLFSNGLCVEAKQIQLLLEPIRQYGGTVLIVIDALDEISDPSSFASTLSRIIPQLPTNVRLILTTRPEHDVLANLGESLVAQVELEIHTSESFKEVKRYMKCRIHDGIQALFRGKPEWDAWPDGNQMWALALKADGLYIWARTAIDYILSMLRLRGSAKRDAVLAEVMQSGFEDLETLYRFILDQALGDAPQEPQRLGHIVQLLGFIVVAEHPFKLSHAIAFLGIPSEDFDCYRFIELSRSLLVPATDAITSSTQPQMHRSFVDFITSNRAGVSQIHTPDHHRKSLDLSFEWMSTHLHFNICNLDSSFLLNKDVPEFDTRRAAVPLGLLYACQSWVSHLGHCDTSIPLIRRGTALRFRIRRSVLTSETA
jgi:hypothetical protein